MIRFREKLYGISSNTARGAAIGATLGVATNKILNSAIKPITKAVPKLDKHGKKIINDFGDTVTGNKVITSSEEVLKNGILKTGRTVDSFLSKFGTVGKWLKGTNKSFWEKLSKLGAWIIENPAQAGIAGAAIGASLAAGYYIIKVTYNKIDQKLTGFKGKMIDKVVDSLIKMNYERDQDFTTNPAQADYLKTKVCIVVSSTKDAVNITVNSVNDPKLEPIARDIIKNLPSGSKFYQRESDKSNELTLAVTHSNNGDHTYIASIIEKFIKKGYPVFILEIN